MYLDVKQLVQLLVEGEEVLFLFHDLYRILEEIHIHGCLFYSPHFALQPYLE